MREKIESLKKINVDLKIDFCNIKNKYILEDMKKEEEEKLEVISNVKKNFIKGEGIDNGLTEMSEFRNKNITEDIQKEDQEKTEKFKIFRDSIKHSERGRRNTINLVAKFSSDLKATDSKKNEQKTDFGLKKIGVDLTADFSSYSKNTNKEEPKNNIFKIELKKVPVPNQNENSTRRSSAASEEAFFSKIKLKPINNRKNTVV